MSRRDRLFCGLLLPLIVGADQISKVLFSRYARHRVIEINSLLSFFYVENTGAAWSIFQGHSAWLGLLGIVVTVVIFQMWRQVNVLSTHLGLTMILGGVIGNTIDRFTRGYVIDFISVNLKFYRWPTFNIADSAIFIGVIILLFTFPKKGQEAS